MISDEVEFRQTLAQLQRMYEAMADLRRNVLPRNPRLYAAMAEGPLDHIRQFLQELDEWAGVTTAEGLLAESDADGRDAGREAASVVPPLPAMVG